jgi:hypothetical protein
MSYNNRMFLSQWNIPGVLGYSYHYDYYGENNTGRVTFADNVTNGAARDGSLDRSWYYEDMGRLFHEAIHGYGGTKGGTSYFDDEVQKGFRAQSRSKKHWEHHGLHKEALLLTKNWRAVMRFVLLMMLTLLIAGLALAMGQQESTGTIRGRVLDLFGNPNHWSRGSRRNR